MKTPKTFRIESDLLAKAKKLGVNLPLFVESSIAGLVKNKICPMCNQKMKPTGTKGQTKKNS